MNSYDEILGLNHRQFQNLRSELGAQCGDLVSYNSGDR